MPQCAARQLSGVQCVDSATALIVLSATSYAGHSLCSIKYWKGLQANSNVVCHSCQPMPVSLQVNYINAHATSTLVGDVAEIKAVKSAFSDLSHMKINGTKSMIGHCLGAAGGMEAIATLKAIQTGWVHPTLNQVSFSPFNCYSFPYDCYSKTEYAVCAFKLCGPCYNVWKTLGQNSTPLLSRGR